MRTYKKRIGKSGARRIDAEKVLNYVEDYYEGHNLKFVVKEIEVPPIRESEEDLDIFNSCFGKRETKHHGYLKWFAYNFVKNTYLERIKPKFLFEKSMYLPDKSEEENSIAKRYGRILEEKEDVAVTVFDMAWTQKVDFVLSIKPIIVECGVTSDMSLAMPLETKAVEEIIWLPYPDGKQDRNNDWEDFKTQLKAFSIKLVNQNK